MKRWTVKLSLIGLVVGLIFATLNYGYIYKSFDDFLALLEICFPFLLIGLMFGLFIDFISVISVSSKDKILSEKNNPKNLLNPDEEQEDKKSFNPTNQDNANTSNNKQGISDLALDSNKINYNDKEVKKTNTEIFASYATLLLETANIKDTNANKLKATVYLCIAQIACLHTVSNGATASFIDAMVEDVKKSILELKMKVKDLALTDTELKKILSDFPPQAKVDGETTINGLAAFEAIYFQYVEELMNEITNHTGGPMGAHGFASIKILEALRGKDKAQDKMIEVSMLISQMTGEVIKAFR